ncbi:MAG: glycosyltransferase, partial [Hymenobacteraceae bacterium]|nr:glycosyltransferase [Hymenobacteraceae bacterium]MDX5396460.1 glycosyltransferase [Hymenobacteraceae bacterium]MDX5442558.1 glycosyltransferase [Hymenobacteraceae bacterium]MDX5512521.1 glycosyltransferase [Hymenobacteraceae bacterium]
TRLLNKGNIQNIINANLTNLAKFEKDFGSVDVIHAQVAYPAGYVAMKISEKINVPFVLTEQMAPFPMKGFSNSEGALKKIIEEPYQKAEINITLTPALEQELRQHHIKRTRVIPNLLDENFFKPSGLKPGNAPFIFFTLGSMIDRKGISELLKSAAVLKARSVDVVFRIGGSGEKEKVFQKLAKDLKIEDKVTWLGPLTREQARDEFQNCSAFVLPSRHESMGVVYAEAIACGKPIIATRCGGPESIVSKENGLLIDVGDVQGLAQAMEYMIDHYREYDPKVIRQDFLERFSSKVVAAKIVALYKEVVENYKPR